MSLEDLRGRNKGGQLDRLLKAASRTSMGAKKEVNTQDVTYYPERDKSGNGSCIIRFLPGLESEDYPYYVERFQHGFQANNKWFIEFCPSTIGKECPSCEDSFDIIGQYGKWDDCPEDIQATLRSRSRTNGFGAGNYCNVLVIKDPANPENEGKVHLFKFGKAIMNFILDMAQPQDDGLGTVKEPVDVFDLVSGANFKFIIRKKDKRADYSTSSFEDPSPCPEFDVDTQKALLPMVDDSIFKSYDDLTERLNKVLNKNSTRSFKSAEDAISSPPTKEEAKSSASDAVNESSGSTGDDDNMAYFQNLAEEVNI